MLDLRLIRTDPEGVAKALGRRGDSVRLEIEELLRLDLVRRRAVTESDALKARRNDVSRQIGELRRKGEDAGTAIEEMREVGDRIDALDREADQAEEEIRTRLLTTPNLPLEEVQEGGVEANEVVRSWGEPRTHPFPARPHWDLAGDLGILDLPRGAAISGSGFPVLRGKGARLQRALIDWMLDIHVEEHGYEELRIPYLVTRDTLTGTGHLPKFEDESYLSDRDDLWLIPTAEVPLTSLHKGEILSAEDLPRRYTAYSPCFRREAGAAGSDTRGLLRVHQFDKVELVRYETPERSREALEEMLGEAETILRRLDLPYRVLRLAGGDLGFASAMTYDLEVWAPGVERWLEVSSVSVCSDFQARRAGIRYRPSPGAKPEFVHTLNGSALALPRVMVALMENLQEEDGAIRVPDAVRDRMGAERLGR